MFKEFRCFCYFTAKTGSFEKAASMTVAFMEAQKAIPILSSQVN